MQDSRTALPKEPVVFDHLQQVWLVGVPYKHSHGARSPPPPAAFARASVIGVGRIAQPVAEEVESQNSNDDVDDRQHKPRIERDDIDILSFVEQNTPTRDRRPQSE